MIALLVHFIVHNDRYIIKSCGGCPNAEPRDCLVRRYTATGTENWHPNIFLAEMLKYLHIEEIEYILWLLWCGQQGHEEVIDKILFFYDNQLYEAEFLRT